MKNSISISGIFINHNGAHESVFKGTVIIDLITGLIVALTQYDPNADLVYPNHQLIFPGFVDVHVHFREDQTERQNYKETFRTGGLAAINGGVVAVASMPNLVVPPTTLKLYFELLDLSKTCPVEVIPYAAIAAGSRPIGLRVPYKTFLGESFGNLRFNTMEEAQETLQHYPEEDVSAHCDHNGILTECKNEDTHEKRRPARSEVEGVRNAIEMARTIGFRLKVVHCSTIESLRLIIKARSEGMNILCEGTSHHALLNESMITEENRGMFTMNPPLRSIEDQQAILHGLCYGYIDMLADDHAPHAKWEKGMENNPETGEPPTVVSGMPMLDTHGLACIEMIKEKGFSPGVIARIASHNPGKWLSQFLEKSEKNGFGYGQVKVGYIGSLTVLDLQAATTVTESMLKTKCGWSPFTGKTFNGSVAQTIIRGVPMK